MVGAISALLSEGADREPEVLEHAFSALAFLWKWLQRPLSADLPLALRLSAPLRLFDARGAATHARDFAAESLAFLFRSAQPAAVPAGARALLLEVVAARRRGGAAAKAGPEEGDPPEAAAAGVLLAEACKGAMQGVHSRAGRLLAFVTDPRLPSAAELAAASSAEAGAAAPVSQAEWEAAAFAVARGALERILAHVRREHAAPLWPLLLAPAAAAAAAAEQGGEGGEAPGVRLARAVALVAQAVEHRRGSRVVRRPPLHPLMRVHSPPNPPPRGALLAVAENPLPSLQRPPQEDYEPLVALCDCLLSKTVPALLSRGAAAPAAAAPAAEALRLLVSVLAGHKAVAGASAGPTAAAAIAAATAPRLEHLAGLPSAPPALHAHLRAFARKVWSRAIRADSPFEPRLAGPIPPFFLLCHFIAQQSVCSS